MKWIRFCQIVFLIFFILQPDKSKAQENGLAMGYGYGILNPHQKPGKIMNDRNYEFFQLGYFYETGIFSNASFTLEPLIAYTRRPSEGFDVGFNLGWKFYFIRGHNGGVYLSAGIGFSYSTMDFQEQGTHYLFSPQAGLGIRWKKIFIEDRIRHYSNAGLASPNRDVNANILNIGIYF